MYDKGPVPGRNDACWCGSGKKYKKCHSAFDERLERLAEADVVATFMPLSLIHI